MIYRLEDASPVPRPLSAPVIVVCRTETAKDEIQIQIQIFFRKRSTK